MPSLKAIRTRIASVKNTQKITKAMKLVAAARLRRAQDAMTAARPYAKRLEEVVADLAGRLQAAARNEDPQHPLLIHRDVKNVRVVVVGSDRGLAGGYNSNLNRAVERYVIDSGMPLGTASGQAPRLAPLGSPIDSKDKYEQIEIATVGRKAREHFRRRKMTVVKEYAGVVSDVAMERARELAADLTKDFLDHKVDRVIVVFNEFKSAISQEVKFAPLLPVRAHELPAHEGRIDFEYEPSRKDVLETILPLYVEISLYRIMLEAIASEFGARMSAMDNATKNAKEMIGSLTLQFNRARQAAITKELMEIVGGAEALKG